MDSEETIPGKDIPRGSLDGWCIAEWYKLSASTSERGDNRLIGYYTDKHAAIEAGRGKGFYCDGEVSSVFVLTHDGKTGFLVDAKQASLMTDQDQLHEAAIQRALDKLSPGERELLDVKIR